MKKDITIHCEYTAGDYISADRIFQGQQARAGIRRVMAVVLAVLGVYMVSTGRSVAWGMGFVGLGFIYWFHLLRMLDVYLAFRRTPRLRGPYDITFSSSGVHWKSPSADRDHRWNHYTKMIEGKSAFLLVSGKIFSPIMKRCFDNAEDIDALRELLKRKIRS